MVCRAYASFKESRGTTMKTYKIVRFKFKGEKRVIKRGLTLEEARKHCNNGASSGDGWFDGYTQE
jgi:hypothetical protein